MSAAPQIPVEKRRSLGVRKTFLAGIRRVWTGARKLSDVSPSERAEALICLDQSIEMLARLTPIAKEVEALLAAHDAQILEARSKGVA